MASPIRYRPDAPEVLHQAVKSWRALDWPAGRTELFLLVNAGNSYEADGLSRDLAIDYAQDEDPQVFIRQVVDSWAQADSRKIGGPRTTGHTTERLAHYRNLILERFQESDADLLLMVDSDVVLAPDFLRRMWEQSAGLPIHGPAMTGRWTLSAQLDNRLAEDHDPASNGQVEAPTRTPVAASTAAITGRYRPAPYATDGSVIEVARAGACTLYPRSVLQRRFRWDPRYNEEHQALFDDLRELWFRHYLLRDPSLCEHRRNRISSGFEVLRQNRERREAAERGEDTP